MALLERVAALIRANVNELIEKAEQPETMIRQIILDMENQLIQVKTQVAISIADQHVLEKRLKEIRESEQQWKRRAGSAIGKEDEALARAAAERVMNARTIAENFERQIEDQKAQVENLKAALLKLRDKLREAEATRDLLVARHRRSRGLAKVAEQPSGANLDRMKRKIEQEESAAHAMHAAAETLDEHFATVENASEIDRLLAEIKADIAGKRKAG